ncbi:XRE family transcriptional regulator [Streptomyces sp. PKU-MA01144]|uniref:XRE family transcriptional regulator n=2 Tax=Streptomyces TaxID=1883 RepID=A0A5R9E9S8_9ACTN|nr:XRE family transcriptional regulator [Streptomyces marianii]NNJ04194.1 XRE family transcriptional regulator [Streptomyces sp. PKU-MA01144]TLQ45795.1 XRE family transcriptional regulator [Streptomyces marianii]
MTHPVPLYRLVSADLLRTLMRRTGTGASVSVRELAALAGIPHGTIGNLLTGEQEAVLASSAHSIAAAIGVDVLVLWIPEGRSAEHISGRAPAVAL